LIVEPGTKLVPLTVRVNGRSPVVALDGDRVVVVGNGLLTVKLNAVADKPPPGAGFRTLTEMTWPLAMSAAGIFAVTWVPPALTVPG